MPAVITQQLPQAQLEYSFLLHHLNHANLVHPTTSTYAIVWASRRMNRSTSNKVDMTLRHDLGFLVSHFGSFPCFYTSTMSDTRQTIADAVLKLSVFRMSSGTLPTPCSPFSTVIYNLPAGPPYLSKSDFPSPYPHVPDAPFHGFGNAV